MSLKKLLAVVGGALALTLAAASPALAQDYPSTPQVPGGRSESDRASGSIRGEGVLPGRVGGGRRDRDAARRERQERQRPATPPPAATPEEIKAAAQGLLTTAGVDCQSTEATNPGLIGEHQVYEVACADAAGYILIASTPPQASNCLELAGSAAIVRSRDAAADVGMQCTLPANQNGLAVIGAMAREAGVACTIDEAVIIGTAGANNVYEVGCAGTDGYRLTKADAGWDLTDCFEVASTGAACRFTTPQEQADTIEAKLTGTEAAGCDVAQARLMGFNANGRFFEVKCAVEGEGHVIRVNAEGVIQRTYTCVAAREQRIGNGCSLTQVPGAEAVPPAA